jgi:hypothetical protein
LKRLLVLALAFLIIITTGCIAQPDAASNQENLGSEDTHESIQKDPQENSSEDSMEDSIEDSNSSPLENQSENSPENSPAGSLDTVDANEDVIEADQDGESLEDGGTAESEDQPDGSALNTEKLTIIDGTYKTETYDMVYPVLSGMKDTVLQEKINNKLFQAIEPLLEEPDEEVKVTFWGDYTIQRFDEEILSISFLTGFYYEGAAHPMDVLTGITINLKTGEKYSFKDLFNEGYDYKSALYEKGIKQIQENEIYLISEYEGIDEEQEFYLTENQLVVFYQTYVYTPYAYGSLKLFYDYEELEGLVIPY